MTREELRDYVEEQRSLNMIPYHVYSTLIDGIDTLEQESVLDKIRAEIKALSPEPTAYDVVDGNPIKDAVWETIADVLQIIDKYKGDN